MSVDDQFYKNEDGVIGWIDQKIMLLARDVALSLRWFTGKENLEVTINYLWYTAIGFIITGIIFNLLTNNTGNSRIFIAGTGFIVSTGLFLILIFVTYIKRWPPFGSLVRITGKGTRIPKERKISCLILHTMLLITFVVSSFTFRINPSLTIACLIDALAISYYVRVKLPPPIREPLPKKVKEFFKKAKEVMKPVPKPKPQTIPS